MVQALERVGDSTRSTGEGCQDKLLSQGGQGAGEPAVGEQAPQPSPHDQLVLDGIKEVQQKMHGAKEFSTEVHQRNGGVDRTPVKEGEPHSVKVTMARTLTTVIHSHPTNSGLGNEAGSWDRNVAVNAPVDVITVYPNGQVTRINTRGVVADLRGTRFVTRTR